jgi:hypothetical protein
MKSSHPSQPHHSQLVIINISLSILICMSLNGVSPVSAAPPHYDYYVDTIIDSLVNTGCEDETDDDTCS